MSSEVDVVKKNRKRKVFGRQTAETGGKPVTLEMRDGFVQARPLHSKKVWVLPVSKVAMLVMQHGTKK